MQLTHGNLYWQSKSKIKDIYPYLSEDIQCDVLVIGGGISGAITTYFLAKEGFNVVMVEKNIIGYGSTMATTALLEYQVDVDLYKLEKMIGENRAKKVYKLCLNSIDEIEKISNEIGGDTGFERKDAIYFSNKFTQKSNMLKEFIERKESGFDAEFLDSHDTLNLHSGILTKDSSGVIDPYKFTQELVSYLYNFDNVRIYENTPIENISCNYDNVECKTNNGFNIVSDKVIFCAGYETLKYIKNTPTELVRTFIIVTKQIESLKEINTNYTARDTGDPYHYIRFIDGNRIMFGGEDIKISEKLTNEKYLSSIANDKYKKLYGIMQRMLNISGDTEIEYGFNGTFANTKDTLPIIDEIESMPNCFCNLGFGANGILYSQIGASMLKDAVKGYFTKDMNMFKINR